MSCFKGRMKEYERISIDRFDGKNLQSTVYFLSHLHEDHTVGLATPVFFKHLKASKNIFLYCSEVTEVLIQASKKYRHLVPYIKKIGINTPTTIEVPDPLFDEVETVTVTFLPAFHCPGSVMCLFEGHEGTVLYTGDFRWEHFHIEQMYHLRSGESVKKVKSLYIDTTFCTPENLYIPSRQHCIDAVYQLVYEWISQSPQHVVYMSLRAQYGHEPLLNAVACRLNKKVHVERHKVEVYSQIQEFHDNFTSDGSSTQIHACGKEVQNIDGEHIPCRHMHDPDKILVILPTTMYFTQFQHLTLDKIVRKVSDGFYRVCYSFHSSYTELKDLISYLKPDNVFPNVKPPNDSKLADVQHRLNVMLKECRSSSDAAGDTLPEAEVKELGTLKTGGSKRVAGKRKQQALSSDTESLDFGTPTKLQKTETQAQRQTRAKGGKAAMVSPEETDLSPVKSRRSGRQTRSMPDVAVDTPTRVSTRLRTKKSTETEVPQHKTPVKKQKSQSPDIFVTPVKSEQSDVSERQSSYAGSHGDESEIDLTLSQESLDLESYLEIKGDNIDTWTGGSFLSAVSSHSSDESDGCVCLLGDVEQTDENYEDVSQIEAEVEEEGLSLEDVEKMETEKSKTSSAAVSPKKTPVRRGRKPKNKAAPKSTKNDNIGQNEESISITVEETKDSEDVNKNEIQVETLNGSNVAKQGDKNQDQIKTVKRSPRQKVSKQPSESVGDTIKEARKNVPDNVVDSKSKTDSKTDVGISAEQLNFKKADQITSSVTCKDVSNLENDTDEKDDTHLVKSVTDKSTVTKSGISLVEESTTKVIVHKKVKTNSNESFVGVENKSLNKDHKAKNAQADLSSSENKDIAERTTEENDKVNVNYSLTGECNTKTTVINENQTTLCQSIDTSPSRNNNLNEDKTENTSDINNSDVQEKVNVTRETDENKIVNPASTKDGVEKDNPLKTSCNLENTRLSVGRTLESDSQKTPAAGQEQKSNTTENNVTVAKEVEADFGTKNKLHDSSDENKAAAVGSSEGFKDACETATESVKGSSEVPNSACSSDEERETQKKTDDAVCTEDVGDIEDICIDDLSKAITESLGSKGDLFEDNTSFEETKQLHEQGGSPQTPENAVVIRLDKQPHEPEGIVKEMEKDNSNNCKIDSENDTSLKAEESGPDSDSDVIMDTPPSETTVSDGKHIYTSTLSDNALASKASYYTRHWPLTGSGSKQERRRKRKRKQKKKKFAALKGIVYYDSDCEIILKGDEKVEIDLTKDEVYDEQDFEYDVRKKLKQTRKRKDSISENSLITVFKTEKVDDYYMYGGVRCRHIYTNAKPIKKLKYTRRGSFELAEETPEDAEFIAELEAAMSKKDNSQSDMESDRNNQLSGSESLTNIDPLYQELMAETPLEAEYEKFMSEVVDNVMTEDNERMDKSNLKNSKEGEKQNTGIEMEIEGSDKINDAKNNLEEELETRIEKDKDIEHVNEVQKSQDDSTKTKSTNANIHYTKTSEGKKLMRISLSGKKKLNVMPSQNYLGTEIFIDLSNEDDTSEITEKNTDLVTEKSKSSDPITLDTHISVSESLKNFENDSEKHDQTESVQSINPENKVSKKSGLAEKTAVEEREVLNSKIDMPLLEETDGNKTFLPGSSKITKSSGKFSPANKTHKVSIVDSEVCDKLKESSADNVLLGDSGTETVHNNKSSECTESESEQYQENQKDVDMVIESVNTDNKDSLKKGTSEKERKSSEKARKKTSGKELLNKMTDSCNKTLLAEDFENKNEKSKEDEVKQIENEAIVSLKDSDRSLEVTVLDDSDEPDKDFDTVQNDKGLDIVYIADDEDSSSSHDSGEWLSCAKAMKEKQGNLKKSKMKTKSKPKASAGTNTKSSSLEKVPVKKAIDKYVKRISDTEKSKAALLSSESEGMSEVKLDQKKGETAKRKAFDTIFNTDDESESKQVGVQQAGPTENLYDETISLSSDSDLDEEIFKKIDSPLQKDPLPADKNTDLSSKSVDVDILGEENHQQSSQKKTSDQIKAVPQPAVKSHDAFKQDKRSGLIDRTKRNKSKKKGNNSRFEMVPSESGQNCTFPSQNFCTIIPPPNFSVPPPNFNPQCSYHKLPPPKVTVSSLSSNLMPPISDKVSSSSPLLPVSSSQSLLSSVTLPSTVVGTLNAVLDVILNTQASTKRQSTDTQIVDSGSESKVTHVQSSDSFNLKTKDRIEPGLSRTKMESEKRSNIDSRNYWQDDRRTRNVSYRHELNPKTDFRDSHTDPRYRAHDSRETINKPPYRYRDEGELYDSQYNLDPRRRLEESDRYRRPVSPFDSYERLDSRTYDRDRARNDGNRELYDDDEIRKREYYDEFYRRRWPYDPYYDPPPPRQSDRPFDPYYDDPPRHPEDPYYYGPPHNPRYHSPPPRYSERYDRYDDRYSGRYDDRYHDRYMYEDRYDNRDRYNDRYDDRFDDRGRYDDTYVDRNMHPHSAERRQSVSAAEHHTKWPVSAEHPDDTASRNVWQETLPVNKHKQHSHGKNIPKLMDLSPGVFPEKNETSTSQSNISTSQNEIFPPTKFNAPLIKKSKPAIIVSRGKKVGNTSQDILKAQTNLRSQTSSEYNAPDADVVRPAFCTGIAKDSVLSAEDKLKSKYTGKYIPS